MRLLNWPFSTRGWQSLPGRPGAAAVVSSIGFHDTSVLNPRAWTRTAHLPGPAGRTRVCWETMSYPRLGVCAVLVKWPDPPGAAVAATGISFAHHSDRRADSPRAAAHGGFVREGLRPCERACVWWRQSCSACGLRSYVVPFSLGAVAHLAQSICLPVHVRSARPSSSWQQSHSSTNPSRLVVTGSCT